ncbi:FEKKY domain-containing protein [Winogradskyella aquimaris]
MNSLISKILIGLFVFTFNLKQQKVTLPEGQEISKESAINDIHYNTKMYWLEYGEMSDHKCKDQIRKKYGLQIYQVAGCYVSEELMAQIEDYNNVIDEYMKEVYDQNWKQKILGPDIDCSKILLEGE